MKKFKINFEEFFEKYNGLIQVVICLVSLIIGAVFDICQENQLGIIIGLLLLLIGELVSLNIKDSITQRKLNNLGVRLKYLRVHYFECMILILVIFLKKLRANFMFLGWL